MKIPSRPKRGRSDVGTGHRPHSLLPIPPSLFNINGMFLRVEASSLLIVGEVNLRALPLRELDICAAAVAFLGQLLAHPVLVHVLQAPRVVRWLWQEVKEH